MYPLFKHVYSSLVKICDQYGIVLSYKYKFQSDLLLTTLILKNGHSCIYDLSLTTRLETMLRKYFFMLWLIVNTIKRPI